MTGTHLSRRDMILMTSGAGALCLGGLVDGIVNRSLFGSSAGLNAAVDRLQGMPENFNDWISKDESLSERERNVAGIRAYVRRHYTHRVTGHHVGLTILCGPSGPMAVHPPTACFEGTGFQLASGPMITSFEVATASQPSEFNLASFTKKETRIPLLVRVFWGWSTTGDWSAPAHPRFAFRGQPWLYKLYVTDHSPSRNPESVIPQADGFLNDALPIIRQALASDATHPDSVSQEKSG